MHGLRKPMADTELDARRLCKPDKHATIFATCAGFRARSRLARNAIHGRRGIGRAVPAPRTNSPPADPRRRVADGAGAGGRSLSARVDGPRGRANVPAPPAGDFGPYPQSVRDAIMTSSDVTWLRRLRLNKGA